MKPLVRIISDGAARKNPEGPGGFGAIVKYYDNENKLTKTEEFAKGYDITTNNRMELMGVITGLQSLKEPCIVTIISDSSYVVNAIEKNWIGTWISNNWKTSAKTPVKNKDLWLMLITAMAPHSTKFEWVKGHAGHPENERCDYLATSFADKKPLYKVNGIYTDVKPSE